MTAFPAASPSGWAPEAAALSALLRAKGLAALTLLLALLLAAAFYGLLFPPLNTPFKVALVLVGSLALLLLALWLAAACAAHFLHLHRSAPLSLVPCFRHALRPLPALLLWLLLAAALLALRRLLVGLLPAPLVDEGFSSTSALRWLLTLTFGALLLTAFVHFTAAGGSGWTLSRLAAAARILLRWRTWVALAAVFLLGLSLPALLISWTPALPGFALQLVSMLLRFALACLLFWLSALYALSLLARLILSTREEPPGQPAAQPA